MLYLIDESKSYCHSFRCALYRRHLMSEGVDLCSFAQNLSLYSNAVAVLLRPLTYSEAEREQLAALCLSQSIPLAFVGADAMALPKGVTVLSANEENLPHALFSLLESLEEAGKCRILALQYHGIRDDIREKMTTLFGLPLLLTPTERMVLRYILYALPQGATAEELMHFCLNPAKDCTPANIPTHIRKINCAFYPCFGCRIITYKAGAYRFMEDLPQPIVG